MPDAVGRFKGISVPDLPWKAAEFRKGDDVLAIATGEQGFIIDVQDDDITVYFPAKRKQPITTHGGHSDVFRPSELKRC